MTQETKESSVITAAQIQFEHLRESLGIGRGRPRLSWRVEAGPKDWLQQAYELEAFDADGQRCGQTGRVESDQSVLVDWPFKRLASRERVAVRVRVWGQDGSASDWSEPATVEAGLLDLVDWRARFVSPDWEEDTSKPQPGPLLRREFELRAGVKQARLYITALGVYEAQINGSVVGDHVMAPGWTSYNHRLRCQTFDVTSLLREGRNAIGAMLGDGWFRGRLGFGGGKANIYGNRLALLAQLEVEYADGSHETITSDEAWQAAKGPIVTNDIYDGETYDARLEQDGWAEPGFNTAGWSGVRMLERDLTTLFAPLGPPVRRIEMLAPVTISTTPTGRLCSTLGRTWSGGCGSASRGRPGRRSPCAMPRCWKTASCRSARCATPPPPISIFCAAAVSRPGSRASPSTASATPRSAAGRAN